MSAAESLPSDLTAAHAMILVERAARIEAEALAARAAAVSSGTEAIIARLKPEIEKLRREFYGSRSERKARLLEPMELQLEDLEADATEDELAAEKAASQTQTVRSFERKRPSRKPFPDHLPRERVVIAAPESCPCCGSTRLSKLGEDVTETLEVIPRQWKVIQTVREKFSCRQCEAITQPPAPLHVTPRGFAGPNLLAMVLFEKFGQHQPLNRQSERYAREGVDLSLSTLADQVGACTAALRPLHALIEDHVLKADRLHGDDTTVPILAKGTTDTGRAWVYVRDDRPFGGASPPAALFYASRDWSGDHPERHLKQFIGILQADACAGYNWLYLPDRKPGPVSEALYWSHARRKFFVLADIAANARRGKTARRSRRSPSKPSNALISCSTASAISMDWPPNSASPSGQIGARCSSPNWKTGCAASEQNSRATPPFAQAVDHMPKRWSGFTRFLDDGRVCLTNNAAERALRGLALGRKAERNRNQEAWMREDGRIFPQCCSMRANGETGRLFRLSLCLVSLTFRRHCAARDLARSERAQEAGTA
ncbi:IS66 family transposase [Mesorhizobium australicum]|uniref:IS66 family transposase n=1 Tax=Mesorhizobium australicum TaxID=536018 RepID=UPI00333763EC